MKITGPGSGIPPEATGEAPGAERAGGKGFADKLDKGDKAGATGAAGSAGQASAVDAAKATNVSDIGADLKAGKITPDAAVDKVVGRILDNHVAGAPPAVRAKVEAALRDALESDPLLADKVKSLSS